jgi:hypothetical protein
VGLQSWSLADPRGGKPSGVEIWWAHLELGPGRARGVVCQVELWPGRARGVGSLEEHSSSSVVLFGGGLEGWLFFEYIVG